MIADEYLVYKFTGGSLSDTIAYLANRDVHPPLWFAFFWGWRRLVGDTDFAGRMQAILLSLVTLSVVYKTGTLWFRRRKAGIAAMTFLASSALFFIYALEIRPYAFAMLLVSLSMLAFQGWLKVQTYRAALVYATSVAMLLYVHYFLFLVILLQFLYLIFFMWTSQKVRNQSLLVALTVLVLWLPWLGSFITQLQHIRMVELADGQARGIGGSSATTQATSIEEIGRLVNLATNGLPGVYIPLLGFGIYNCFKKPNFRLALIWCLGIPILAFTLNFVIAVYTPRYIVNFVIGLALVLGAGFAYFDKHIFRLGLVAFAVVSLWAMPLQLPQDIVPYRLLLQNFVAAYQPNDAILIDPPSNGNVVFNWQYAHQFSDPMYYAMVNSVDKALSARRIWYFTNDWFNNNIQAHYKQIEASHPRQDGFGQCDIHWCFLIQLMESPPLTTPQTFGTDMPFWGMDIDAITSDSIQTRLWWRVNQTPTADYSIGLHLIALDGTLVAQADGPIHHYGTNIYNTSQLEPGKIYIDFRKLVIPPDLPPGNYQLKLVVYRWQTDERLKLADGSDYLLLAPVTIP